MSRRKPKPGRDVIVTWLDSGHNEEGDPENPKTGVLAVCHTSGKVISCEKDPELKLRKGMDATSLRIAVNHSGPKDKQVDIFTIWWPSVVSIRTWKEEK